jgi:hypothetical protein
MKSKFTLAYAVAIALSLFPLGTGHVAAQEGGLWGPKYRPVIVNTKASGAGLTSGVGKFPVLIRLDSANAGDLLAQATPGGGDLRVTDATGTTPVAFEVEYWSAAEKHAAIWILADTVKAGDSAIAFRLYWGRDGAASNSNPAAVFDTANGFQAVFHFSEGNNDTGYDATGNVFRAAPYNAPRDTIGVIGRARRFNGTDQRFQIPNSASGRLNFELADSYTLSTWAYPTAIAVALGGHKMIEKGDNQYSLSIYGNSSPKYWDWIVKIYDSGTRWMQTTSEASQITADSSVRKWRLVTGVFKGAPVNGAVLESLYVDGILAGTTQATYTNATQGRTTTFNVGIGFMVAGTPPLGSQFSRFWNGALDEVRLENRARSASWIKLSYATQRPGANAVTVGPTDPPVSIARANGAAMTSASVSFSPHGNGLLFRVHAPGAARVRLDLTDTRGTVVWTARTDARSNAPLYWNADHAAPGVYALRARLEDGNGIVIHTSHHKVPFTR